jgi:hypothetical protein
MSECPVTQIYRIGPDESKRGPQNRKSENEVAREFLPPWLKTKIWDTQHLDQFWERKHGDRQGHEDEADRWEGPISKAGIQNIEHFDEVVVVH